MENIPLQAIPHQKFNIVFEDIEWTITLRTASGITSVSFDKNNVSILKNIIAVSGALIIPYQYLENGNFIFITKNHELPYYEKFNITQFLVYVSQSELDALRATKKTNIINKSNFNSFGAIPLRFEPQGYV